MSTNYGTDTDAITTLPRRRAVCSGPRNVGNALARRLSTPAGALLAISPEYGDGYGYDLRALLNSSFSPAQEADARAAITAQALADERIASVDVGFDLDRRASTLTVSLEVELAEGEAFVLVLAVSALTVEILRNAP